MLCQVNVAVWVLVALSAGVAVNVTLLQRGTAANWAVRGAFQPVMRGATTEAGPQTSANPSDSPLTLGQYSPVFGVGGHDGRSIGGVARATSPPPPGSTVRDVSRIAEDASAFTASNDVDVIRAVQRELGRRGYKPGLPTGVSNVATRGAIMAYQRDHGLPLTGEPSDALLKAIVFASPGGVGAPNSVGTKQGNTVGDVGRLAGSASTLTESNAVEVIRAGQRELGRRGYKPGIPNGMANATTRVADMAHQSDHSPPLTGEPSEPLRKAMVFDSSGAAPAPGNSIGTEQGKREGPINRVVTKRRSSTSRASQRTTQVASRPHVYGREMITSSTSPPRPTTFLKERKQMSEQRYVHSEAGMSGLKSLIWTQFPTVWAMATTVAPATPNRVVHNVQGRQPGTSETKARPRFRPVPNSPLKFPDFPEVIR
jgi:peptidoglycan hydrolase-like protein with peptidoglycan-binding domain